MTTMNYFYENYSLIIIFIALFFLNLCLHECWARIDKTFKSIITETKNNNYGLIDKQVTTSELALNPQKLDLLLYNAALFSLLNV
jgi:hypothetical protein